MRSKQLTLTVMALTLCAAGGCPTTPPDDDSAMDTAGEPSTTSDPALDAPTGADGAGGVSDIVPSANLDGGWTVPASTLGACIVVSDRAITSVNNSCAASLSRFEVDQVVAVRREQNNADAAAQIQLVLADAEANGLSQQAIAAQIDAISENNRQANFSDAVAAHLSNAESRLLIGQAELTSLVSAVESAALGRTDFLALARRALDASNVRVFLASAPSSAASEGDQFVWVVQFTHPDGMTGVMTFNLRRLSDEFLQGEVIVGISTVAVSMLRQ